MQQSHGLLAIAKLLVRFAVLTVWEGFSLGREHLRRKFIDFDAVHV